MLSTASSTRGHQDMRDNTSSLQSNPHLSPDMTFPLDLPAHHMSASRYISSIWYGMGRSCATPAYEKHSASPRSLESNRRKSKMTEPKRARSRIIDTPESSQAVSVAVIAGTPGSAHPCILASKAFKHDCGRSRKAIGIRIPDQKP